LSDAPPPGYEPWHQPSPFITHIGPLWRCERDGALVTAFRVLPHHANRRGWMHGGAVLAVVDVALGRAGEHATGRTVGLVTVSITHDYLGAARLGDWIEIVCDSVRVGRSLAHMSCSLRRGDEVIGRARGIYQVRPPVAPTEEEGD
jgi:uncharacterized protein (TIGR00369 family)